MAGTWDVLRKIGLHTLNSGAAISSFAVLAWTLKKLVHDQTLLIILNGVEDVVLIVLILIFAFQVIYDVLPEKIRGYFTSKVVFA